MKNIILHILIIFYIFLINIIRTLINIYVIIKLLYKVKNIVLIKK